MRSIYTQCGAKAIKNEAGKRWPVRKAADPVMLRSALRLLRCVEANLFVRWKVGGKTYCHIMDPHAGWSVENMLSTVAIAPTGTESEVLTKIFFVGGVENSCPCLASHANALAVFYQPGEKPQTSKRMVLHSKSFQISSDKFAELE